MSPKSPVSTEKLRSLRQYRSNESSDWHAIAEQKASDPQPGFVRPNIAIIALAGALLVSFAFLGWAFGSRLSAVSRQLDQTKLELAAANSEVARLQGAFAEVSVLHTLWGMGSQFGAAGAGVCRGDEDKANVRAATLAAIEMWSDSEVRAEMNLERSVLPVLQGLRQQGIQVVGASLSPGVIAQYRRFRREGVGDVVMLDRSRIIDAESREAALALLRRAGEGQLDPAQTHVVYRFDQYGAVTYPLIQGPSDAAMLTARLSDEPLAEPVTVAATDFPCS